MLKGSCAERALVIVLMASYLTGCMTWRPETLAPAEIINGHQPHYVRVERTDGSREVLYQPEIRADSLWGRVRPESKGADRALALSDIKHLATPHVSPARTSVLLLSLGAVVAAFVALASMQGPFDNWGQ